MSVDSFNVGKIPIFRSFLLFERKLTEFKRDI